MFFSFFPSPFSAAPVLVILLNISACQTPSPVIQGLSTNKIIYNQHSMISARVEHLGPDNNIVIRPAGPTQTDKIYTAYKADKILRTNGALFVATKTGEIVVYADKQKSPTPTSVIDVKGSIRDMQVSGNFLYVATNKQGIYQFDISENSQVKLTMQINLQTPIKKLQINKNTIYALTDDNYFKIINTNNTINKDDKQQALTSKQFEHHIHDFVIQGNYCFFVGPVVGLVIYDCSDKKVLALLGQFKTAGTAQAISIKNTLAYIADGEIGLTVLDFSDPQHIRWRGSHNKVGAVNSVVSQNDIAIVQNNDRLVSLNIKNPDLPITASFYKTDSLINDFIFDDTQTAFVTSDTGIEQIDFRRKAKIQISNEGINQGGSRRAYIKNDIAYVADWFSGLHIYDISKPDSPLHIGNYHTPGSSKGVVVKDSFAFVGDDDHGLQVIDVSNPRKPFKVAEMPLTGLAYTLKLVGDLIYLADHRGGFHIIDISEPAKPKHISAFDTNGKSWAIDVKGDYAYIADDSSGLLVFNISSPSKPVFVSDFNPGGFAEDVIIKDNIAYVTFFDKGLYLIDISDPLHPHQLSHLPIPGNARSIKIEGDFAYVAGWESGLVIIDISNKHAPGMVRYVDTNGSSWGADLYKNHAYVWDWWGGIKVIDIQQPTQAKLISQYHASDTIHALTSQDNYIYTANGNAGLQVYDINNPLNPIWTTGIGLAGDAVDIATTDSHAYVATTKGISVVDISMPFNINIQYEVAHDKTIRSIQVTDNHVIARDDENTLLHFLRQSNRPLQLQTKFALMSKDFFIVDNNLLAVTDDGLSLLSIEGGLESGLAADRQTHLYQQRNLELVSADKNIIVVTEKNVAVHILQLSNNKLHRLSRYTFTDSITDIQFSDSSLYLYSPAQGLQVIDLSSPRQPRLKNVYAATGDHTTFITQTDYAFFAGEDTIASVDLLPFIASQIVDAETIQLSVPKTMPLGHYQPGIQDGEGSVNWSNMTFEVSLSRRKKPRFSMEKFRQILQQQGIKSNN